MSKASLNKAYKEAFDRLNDAQRKAVTTTEGPVLVIAGPGTGKTQTLAARIGYLIEQGRAQHENILCLTYTEAGSIAMRQRLVEFMGADAYRVSIFTFHSFCNTVIQDHKELFGLSQLDPLSELEEILLLRNLVDGFSKDNPLKRFRGDTYYETGRLKKLFNLMEREGWTDELIQREIDAYIDEIPELHEFLYKRTTKKYKAGEPIPHKVEKELENMALLRAAAKAYRDYKTGMHAELNRYNFNDMILWVIQELINNKDLLLEYQERYQYFLVDEFQDTNGTQNILLNQLISYWESPNVFAVGDDDQSIFRFQGAQVANISEFYENYKDKGLQVVVMEDNYRSVQPVLDMSQQLIEHNHGRLLNSLSSLSLSKNLRSSHPDLKELSTLPEIRKYPNEVHESADVAHRIAELVKSGVPGNEIAVIYRKHKQAEPIVRCLQMMDIPVSLKKRSDVLDAPIVQQLLQLLRYLQSELEVPSSADKDFYEILHFPGFGISPKSLARLYDSFRKKWTRSERHGPPLWREFLRNAPEFVGASLGSTLFDNRLDEQASIKRVAEFIDEWIRDTPIQTVPMLLERVMTEGGFITYTLAHPEKLVLLQELSTFFEFVKQESARRPGFKLRDLLDTIAVMKKHYVGLEVQQVIQRKEGVQMLTAHGAKGLEFQHVFLIGCDSKEWGTGKTMMMYKLPPNLSGRDDIEDEEESRRLFYVALTRAKIGLHISYAHLNSVKGGQNDRSKFIAELLEVEHMEEQPAEASNQVLLHQMVASMQLPNPVNRELLEEDSLRRKLEKYALSVTHLNTYLKCPLSYYYKYMLRLPSAKSPAATFGSAVHHALENLFRKMKAHPEQQFPSVDSFVKDFEWYMNKHQDSFTEEKIEKRLEYGAMFLPKYYKQYVDSWNKDVITERNFAQVVFNEVPIKGKLDKLEFISPKQGPKQVRVIDYKTGMASGQWYQKKFKKPSPEAGPEDDFETRFGGDYWRQAVFYKILLNNDLKSDYSAASAAFDYVEPDKKDNFTIREQQISQEDIEIVGTQIKAAWEGIHELKFDGCGDCEWCDFVRRIEAMAVPQAKPPKLQDANDASEELEEELEGVGTV